MSLLLPQAPPFNYAMFSFALSEPEAGTDAANQKTRAVRSGNGYRITGRKVWVANADAASVAIVFACTRPGLRGQGVTAFLVPMDAPGITRVARADSLGVRGLGCILGLELVRVGVRVAADLGEQERINVTARRDEVQIAANSGLCGVDVEEIVRAVNDPEFLVAGGKIQNVFVLRQDN